jgi:hypothetical protein
VAVTVTECVAVRPTEEKLNKPLRFEMELVDSTTVHET